MGTLVVLEGLDGAGKRTLAGALTARWASAGLSVFAETFPRYGRSVHADLAAEALHGEHGDVASSVYAMSLLFALDRQAAADDLRAALDANDVVLLDRYVASNAAYSAARLGEPIDGPLVTWVQFTEFERFGLPRPDVQVFLDAGVALAAQRAQRRAVADPSRRRDAYERDDDLQRATGQRYADLAVAQWISPWRVVGPDVDATQLAAELLG